MRICLFTPTFLPLIGGTEFVTDSLARQFCSKGHDVVVLAHGRQTELAVPYDVVWYSKPILHRWFPERIGRHLHDLHKRHRFDIVAANYGTPTGYAAVRIGHRKNVPVVVVSHGGDLHLSSMRRRHKHLWTRIERAYRQADGLVAISPYVEQLIRQINPDPNHLELIANGIDPDDLNRPAQRPGDYDDTRPFCLALGNLRPMKGFDDAIKAFARIRSRIQPTILVIVGAGKLDAELRQEAKALNVSDDVLFLGPRTGSDKRWLLQNCRFGVAPSIEEGHPIVGLEFLAVGKPLICSTIEAFDGMHEDQVNALRVEARQPEQLAEAILRMDTMDLEAMGAISRQRARSYGWPEIADRYLSFFETVIAQHRAQSAHSAA